MKKLKHREKVGIILGVIIIIFGSFLEGLESELGIIPNWAIAVGFILIICLLVYINYGREGKEEK